MIDEKNKSKEIRLVSQTTLIKHKIKMNTGSGRIQRHFKNDLNTLHPVYTCKTDAR